MLVEEKCVQDHTHSPDVCCWAICPLLKEHLRSHEEQGAITARRNREIEEEREGERGSDPQCVSTVKSSETFFERPKSEILRTIRSLPVGL
jgi:hypothetical protein